MKKLALITIALLLAAGSAFGAILVDEEFTHADGNLVGQTPTPGPGGAWANHSGTGTFIQVSGGQITLSQGAGSREDANTSFTAIGSGEILFASFDVTVPSGQTVNPDADGLYFAHFRTGTTFRSRVFITAPASGGDFGIGLSDASTGPTLWPADLSFDTTYQIIVSYDFDSGAGQLWIDATTSGDPSITISGTASAAIDSYAFRQSGDYTGSQVIDNLVVGNTFPEVVPVELMSFSVD